MGQIIFFILIMIWVILDIRVGVIGKKTLDKKKVIEKKSKYIIIICIVIGMSFGPIAFSEFRNAFKDTFDFIRYVGLLVIGLGLSIRVIAIRQLGQFFSDHVSINHETKFFNKGLYKIIRHPSYLGEILIFLGVAIVYNHVMASMVALIIPTLGFIYRIEVEEKALALHYKKDYKNYQEQTNKLIPKIY